MVLSNHRYGNVKKILAAWDAANTRLVMELGSWLLGQQLAQAQAGRNHPEESLRAAQIVDEAQSQAAAKAGT